MSTGQDAVLAVDTSGSPLLVACRTAQHQVARRRSGIKQERLLFPLIEQVLSACDTSLQQVRKVCIVRGPGRFTGIRIGLTFASMMHYLNNAEVYGATVFELLRRQTVTSAAYKRFCKQHPNGVLGVVLHAFREEYFLQIFDGPSSVPAWLSREELGTRLSNYPAPLFLTGTDKDGADLTALTQGKFPLAAAKDSRVRPETLLSLAQDDACKVNALEPLYLKPARFELITPQ